MAAVPYDVVSTTEARELAAGNPLSFLRVSRAEIELPRRHRSPRRRRVRRRPPRTSPGCGPPRPLIEEAAPSLYVYRLRMGDHEQTGVAACFSVDEYERDVILKHERTRKDKEDDRTRHIVELRAQTGPVFLTYPASTDVDAVDGRDGQRRCPCSTSPPSTASGTPCGGRRRPIGDDLVAAFATGSRPYIADGHHRAASAMRPARQALRASVGRAEPRCEADSFLAVAFPHDQMQILPYHRFVTDLAGRTPARRSSTALGERATRSPADRAPATAPAAACRARVAMYLDGRLVQAPPDARRRSRLARRGRST